MNIAFANFIGTDKLGGGEKWMISAAAQLAACGHNVLIMARAGSKFLTLADKAGLVTLGISKWHKLSGIYLYVVRKALADQKNEILICNLNTDVRSVGLLAKISGTPVVLARHGILMYNRKKFRYWLSAKYILDGIITNSNTIKETYAGYGWFDNRFVKVIHNGISIPEHVVPFDFGKSFPGKKIIYSAGRLSEQKGFTYLIEAAALLKKSRNDLLFAVSGEGRLEEDLKNQAREAGLEDSFIFLGFSADIYPFLRGCDLFVLSSLFEGMPNVIMEAMAMNKPVVATDVNGARELMIDGKTGLIVPPKNPAALAEAITAIIENPDMLADFGNTGYERVNQTFTMTVMTDSIEAYLDQKLKEKQNRKL
ncbi:MAG: glycosyltransferase [Chlorobiaceae bacterium]|nr:glycosyltransferase [Chlorobiaceae bacterium]